MSNDFSSVLAAGIQGSHQVERKNISEETVRSTDAATRLHESRTRAEKSAGVGTVENESQKTSSERDGDGHLFSSTVSTRENHKMDSENGSIDISGEVGTQLDYFC